MNLDEKSDWKSRGKSLEYVGPCKDFSLYFPTYSLDGLKPDFDMICIFKGSFWILYPEEIHRREAKGTSKETGAI